MAQVIDLFSNRAKLKAQCLIDDITPSGEELALIVRQQFHTLQAFQQNAKGATREWRIGAGDTLLQWLVIPALSNIHRSNPPTHYVLENLRTSEIAGHIQDQRLDFGLLRTDAVSAHLASAPICLIRYVVIVPHRLKRGSLSLKKALLECPHAMVTGDGQMVQRLKTIAHSLGGILHTELRCDSLGQCLAAVRTGAYAAVIPSHAVESTKDFECTVVDEGLENLDRSISLMWNPKLIDVLGVVAEKACSDISGALCEEAAHRGMSATPNE